MKTLATLTLLTVALAVAGTAAARGLATVTLVDRDSGTVLNTYYHRGEYWVAGRPGARYAIEVRNCSSGRLLAVTSVDGVNVISGETAGWGQAGYVFDPGEGYEINGWRKSQEEVAAFTFTEAGDSYAGRTGRPANVGVIGVALFRERALPQAYSPPRIAPQPYGADADRAQAERSSGLAAQSAPAVPPAAARELMMPAPAAKLGTGHGEREVSYMREVAFQRMQPEPNEIIRIRYDSYENLVAIGVIPGSRPLLASPNPFPASRRQFVPDPPG